MLARKLRDRGSFGQSSRGHRALPRGVSACGPRAIFDHHLRSRR